MDEKKKQDVDSFTFVFGSPQVPCPKDLMIGTGSLISRRGYIYRRSHHSKLHLVTSALPYMSIAIVHRNIRTLLDIGFSRHRHKSQAPLIAIELWYFNADIVVLMKPVY
ncbi:Hypothetical predicted protein [Octopus vulgaris]|uniref:Uncharacterized protein n=1 Tax=Octopus vulgaris TaxID=6645 RepID=A0AA36FM21_OCTVU|nr:Hypothetical predicted protein [Octopus vulgaris]